ncbi:MAG TPA: hypothetical protein DCQ94_14950 [Nitrospira sp.]|nr:hypothetical protein [Nitrospira sp.]
MGKPFQSELEQLAGTIRWVSDAVLPQIKPQVIDRSLPAFCIGSGGSQSAADFLARLIRAGSGFAWATTPLEYLHLGSARGRSSAFLISASGRNKDIVAAARQAVGTESALVGALVARCGSALGEVVSSYSGGALLDFDIPSGKDGFLATNSLIAMMISLMGLSSADRSAFSIPKLIDTANEIASQNRMTEITHSEPEVIILHAGWGGPAASDLESKLSEAALAPAMICDLRNFGHGRHHWLAKRGARTLVVTVEDKQFAGLFTKTLNLLPPDISIIRLQTKCSGPSAAIDLTMRVFGLVRDMGLLLGIDPGRPGVPEFGRKIYHLSPGLPSYSIHSAVELAATRKSLQFPSAAESTIDTLKASASEAKTLIESLVIKGLVLDFDGTLVDTKHRFDPIGPDIANELSRLLRSGTPIGIATGRGKSVRKSLRAALPKDTWGSVLVGYYNGSEIIALNDEREPDNSTPETGELADLERLLESDPWIASVKPRIELRPHQLSISGAGCAISSLWNHVYGLLCINGLGQLKCLSSTHSVDILGACTSKTSVIEAIRSTATCQLNEVLCIGDSGLWPGNDAELLAHNPSVSCGSPSTQPSTGWNFAPQGLLESRATLYYLRNISSAGRILIPSTKGGARHSKAEAST